MIVRFSPIDVFQVVAHDAFKCAEFFDDLVDSELLMQVFFSIKQVLELLVRFDAAAFAPAAPPLHVHAWKETAFLLHVIGTMARE